MARWQRNPTVAVTIVLSAIVLWQSPDLFARSSRIESNFQQQREPDFAAIDEQMLREELALPASASLISYEANPSGQGGWFGREGLRIFAVFQFDRPTLESYLRRFRPEEWQSTPIPSDLIALRDGLDELQYLEGNNYFLADVAPMQSVATPPWQSYYFEGIPERIGRHRVVVAVPDSSQLSIVYKNHY